MTALTHRREPSARAWHEFSQRAQPVDVAEMQAAMRLASQKNVDYLDALKEVRQYDPDPPTPAEVAEAFRFKYL